MIIDPLMQIRWVASGALAVQARVSLDEKESWPRLLDLASFSSVELPGIEPDALPGLLVSEQAFRSVSF